MRKDHDDVGLQSAGRRRGGKAMCGALRFLVRARFAGSVGKLTDLDGGRPKSSATRTD